MSEVNQLIQQLVQSGDSPHPDLLADILACGEAAVEPLIAIASDPRMYWDDIQNRPRQLPAYAISLLGDLRAETAIPALIKLFYWPDMGEGLELVVSTLARIAWPRLSQAKRLSWIVL
jgi:hypothetical protein